MPKARADSPPIIVVEIPARLGVLGRADADEIPNHVFS